MFIEKTFGKEMIIRIVRECNDGDVFRIIGENFKDFEKRWKEWLVEHWRNIFNFA